MGKERNLPPCRQIRGKTNCDKTCESRSHGLNTPHPPFHHTTENRQNLAPQWLTDCEVSPGKIWVSSKCFFTTISLLTSKIGSTFKKSTFALDLQQWGLDQIIIKNKKNFHRNIPFPWFVNILIIYNVNISYNTYFPKLKKYQKNTFRITIAIFYLYISHLSNIQHFFILTEDSTNTGSRETDILSMLAIFTSEGINKQVSNVLFSMKKDKANTSWLKTVTKVHKMIRKKDNKIALKILALRLWELTLNGGVQRLRVWCNIPLDQCLHHTCQGIFLTGCLFQHNLHIRWSFCVTERSVEHEFFSKGQGSRSPTTELTLRLEHS